MDRNSNHRDPDHAVNIAYSTKQPFTGTNARDPVDAIWNLIAIVCGGVVLAGAYLYIYLAATGQFAEDNLVKEKH